MKLSEEKMQYLENIRQQLCKGTLSHEDAERFMLDAIEKEVEKESADYDWIEACCQFLEENIPMTAMQDNWPDHQQSNWESIQVAINDENKLLQGNRAKQNTWKKLVAAAACVATIVGGISFSLNWYQGTQLENGQVYGLTGQKVEISNSQSAAAADDGTLQELETDNYADVVSFLGITPPIPHWCPEGWETEIYYAASSNDYWDISIYYSALKTDVTLPYMCVYATDPSTISASFPQDSAGKNIVLENGINVYFSTNAGETIAIWQQNNQYMFISGPVSMDDIAHMIGSIYGGNRQ